MRQCGDARGGSRGGRGRFLRRRTGAAVARASAFRTALTPVRRLLIASAARPHGGRCAALRRSNPCPPARPRGQPQRARRWPDRLPLRIRAFVAFVRQFAPTRHLATPAVGAFLRPATCYRSGLAHRSSPQCDTHAAMRSNTRAAAPSNVNERVLGSLRRKPRRIERSQPDPTSKSRSPPGTKHHARASLDLDPPLRLGERLRCDSEDGPSFSVRSP